MSENNTEQLKKLADALLPEVKMTPEEIVAKYPARNLAPSIMVTRIAPSPTGFLHIGGLYTAMISERLAHQSGGVFYLRIEDTDKKREVAGAVELIINTLREFKIKVDEGEIANNKEIGNYGPYKQSAREDIYKVFIKKLIEDGLAYPAFESSLELEEIAKRQGEIKIAPGYYGQWATWSHKTAEEYLAALENGLKPVIRLRSQGDTKNFVNVEDLFKGKLHLPESDQDIVILKSDGLPTYHFAHVIDDHFMGTTHVLRGDEWLASLSLHLQLFNLMGWTPPVYGHLAPIQKLDNGNRRKLSKRHDPEATMTYYQEAGYPVDAVIMYLLNLANSGFEKWLLENPNEDLNKYSLSINELKKGAGALLDLVKMDSFSKELIGRMPVEKVVELALVWARQYDNDLARIMESDLAYTTAILNIERGNDKARKDLTKWSDLRVQIGFMFDEIFSGIKINTVELEGITPEDIKAIIVKTLERYNLNDDKDTWLQKIKDLAVELGFAPDVKTFKAEPDKYKGHFGDVAKVLRILLVGENKSPDLYEMMKVMGGERIARRLNNYK
ncbi:MAG: glutamate--tRNA ligase family protein [Candidatus Falkowbacteria bacterium]